MAAYIPEYVNRQIEKNKQNGNSIFVASVGEKVAKKIEVTGRKVIEGYHGDSYCYTMKDQDGNLLGWFASKDTLKVGDKCEITGTVKELTEWQGIKKTMLTRCKVK